MLRRPIGGQSGLAIHGLHGAASVWNLPHECGLQRLPQLVGAFAIVPDPTTEATWLVNEMTMLHNNRITAPIFWYDLHEESSCDVGFGLTMRNNGSGRCASDTYNPVYSSFRGIADPVSDLVISITPFYPFLAVTVGKT